MASEAREALSRAVATLPRLNSLPQFLEALLREALQTAGARNGAVALLDAAQGSEVADHVVVLWEGKLLSPAERKEYGLGPLPLGDAGRAFVERLSVQDEGLTTAPPDAVYGDRFRRSLASIGVRTIHSVGLRVGSTLIGWLGAGYREPGPPTRGRIALLRSLSEQMTMAVELTRMAERSEQAAIAREKAEASQWRIDQLLAANKALTDVMPTLEAEPAVEAMLRYLLRTLSERLLGAGGLGALLLADSEQGVQHRHLVYQNGEMRQGDDGTDLPGAASGPIHPLMLDEPFRRGEPHWIGCDRLSPERSAFLKRHGCNGMIVLPMSLSGQPVGAFVLALREGQAYPNAEDLHVAQALAQQATIAIQLTRLADAARRAAVAREREAAAQARVGELVRANGALKRSLDLIADDSDIADTLGRLLQVVSEEIGCSRSTLCLRDETTGVFDIERMCVDGMPLPARSRSPHAHLCPARGSTLWRAIVEERRAVAFESVEGAAPVAADVHAWFALSGARSLIGVPLLQRGEVIGCFTFRFDTPQFLSTERLELVQTLAHQATLSVQLERLARAAQSKSHRAATLAERARIARDLHDTLAQGLTGILMHLQAAERAKDDARLRMHVRAALDVARGALVDAGRSVYALRSIASERAEFAAALKAVLKTTFAGSDVALEVGGAADLGGLAEAAEKELLRIAQEAATNALKHAQATRFDAVVTQDEAGIVLELADDGRGFDTGATSEGFGLVGMRERAERAGAAFHVESRAGSGTRIRVSIAAARLL